jgi:hypothetical protein
VASVPLALITASRPPGSSIGGEYYASSIRRPRRINIIEVASCELNQIGSRCRIYGVNMCTSINNSDESEPFAIRAP